MYLLLLAALVSEILLFLVPMLWKRRRHYILIPAIFIIAALPLSFYALSFTGSVLIVLLSLFRLGNLLRIFFGRMHERYLFVAARRTVLWLAAFGLVLLLLQQAFSYYEARTLLRLLIPLQLLVSLAFAAVTLKNISKLGFKMPQIYLIDRELPTVTVAIPARNETDELAACLRTVLASDYPKLEVLVLDDCSQTKTADVISSFAQNGVRFIKGDEPAERWLAKNQAYQTLYEHASGDLILFCGVDVRLGPGSIRSMVNLMYARKKSMLSVLPVRQQSSAASAFIQPNRYWWELSLPRRMFNRPPVLSTCWMIGRLDLKKNGEFKAVNHSILPERYFARELIKSDGYSFIRSAGELKIETVKPFHEQYATAIRTRYPQMRRRPEWVLLSALGSFIFLFLPFLFLLAGLTGNIPYFVAVIFTCASLVTAHVAIVSATNPASNLLACVTFPVVALMDIVIGFISMIQYEFFQVNWKDRNICIPVMHVIPRLPELRNK